MIVNTDSDHRERRSIGQAAHSSERSDDHNRLVILPGRKPITLAAANIVFFVVRVLEKEVRLVQPVGGAFLFLAPSKDLVRKRVLVLGVFAQVRQDAQAWPAPARTVGRRDERSVS